MVYADRLADPGNLGTLVRAAAAFAAAALIASPGAVDLFSPKVVRAGMGAVFALPLYQDMPLEQAVTELGAQTVYGLVAHGGAPLDTAWRRRGGTGRRVLVVGAERAGLSPRRWPASPISSRSLWPRRRPRGRVPERRRGRRHRAV